MKYFQRVQVMKDLDNPDSDLVGMTGRVVQNDYLAEVNDGKDQCNLVRLENNAVLCFVDEELSPLPARGES